MEQLQKFSPEKITSDLLPQKFGRRGMIWTGILLFICAIGAFAYIQAIKKRIDGNQYGGLCFLGNLYFKLCFFCGHQPGGFIDHCHLPAGKCSLAYTTDPDIRNDCCIGYYFCFTDYYCGYGPARTIVIPFYPWPYTIAHYVGCNRDHHLFLSQPFFVIHYIVARYQDHDQCKRKIGQAIFKIIPLAGFFLERNSGTGKNQG